MAVKPAGERLYGQASPNAGILAGHRFFCSDMTSDVTVYLVAYEDCEAVFIDAEYNTRSKDP